MDETNSIMEQVIAATGLPEATVQRMLNSYILESGMSPQNLSMEDFKDILVNLLQDVFLQIKNGENPNISFQD